MVSVCSEAASAAAKARATTPCRSRAELATQLLRQHAERQATEAEAKAADAEAKAADAEAKAAAAAAELLAEEKEEKEAASSSIQEGQRQEAGQACAQSDGHWRR